jgi:hypothetical protein
MYAIAPAAANADWGFVVTVEGTSPIFIGATQIQQNADTRVGTSGGAQFVSTRRMAQLGGVDPATLSMTTAMTITDPPDNGLVTLTRDQVVSGSGYFAVSGPTPIFSPSIDSSQADSLQTSDDNILVDLELSPGVTVLGVPAPVVTSLGNPGVGVPVEFAEPGPISTNALTPNSPDEGPSGLTYSWDFGDGQTATGPLGVATISHTYAAGTYQVRVTVEDGQGDGGVSPALSVAVGSVVPGRGGSTTGAGGKGVSPSVSPKGSAPTGGGTAPAKQKALPSGPAAGSLAATTQATGSGTGPAGSLGGGSGPPAAGAGRSGGSAGQGRTGGGVGATSTPLGASTQSARTVAQKAGGKLVGRGSQARSTPAKRSAALGQLAPANLTGVLLDAVGTAASGAAAGSTQSALSALQSVARASVGSGKSQSDDSGGGLPAWLLGILATLLLLVSGIVREAGPRAIRRLRIGNRGGWRAAAS